MIICMSYVDHLFVQVQALIPFPMSFSQVVIYSKSYCPYCDKTKSLFQSQFPASNAKVYELDQMNDGSEIQNALAEITGQRTVPNVWVKGKFIGGNDDVHSVLRSGKLKEMLS